jgi:hypothetical protein
MSTSAQWNGERERLLAEIGHLRDLLNERDTRYGDRFEAQQRAILKAEEATERRFEGVNEFRAQLADQQRTFLPRSEYDVAHRELSEKINIAIGRLNDLDTAMSSRSAATASLWGYMVGAAGVAIAIIGIVLALTRRG